MIRNKNKRLLELNDPNGSLRQRYEPENVMLYPRTEGNTPVVTKGKAAKINVVENN